MAKKNAAKSAKKSNARKTSTTPTQIWSFGARPPERDAELIRETLFRARRYGNHLVEIERDRVESYQAIRARHCPAIAVLQEAMGAAETEVSAQYEAIKKDRAKRFARSREKSLEITPERKALLASAKAHRADVSARLKLARAEFEATLNPVRAEHKRRLTERKAALSVDGAKCGPRTAERVNAETLAEMVAEDWPAAWRELVLSDASAVVRNKARRALRDFGTGTGLLVESAIAQSIKDARPEPPNFRRFAGEGRLGGQVKNCTIADLLSGKNTMIRLRQSEHRAPKSAGNPWHPGQTEEHGERHRGQWWMVSLNIGSGERGKPTWVEFAVRMHRPLPMDGVVKWAWIKVSKTGDRMRYDLQLTLEAESFRLGSGRPAGVGRVAVNFGWRKTADGVRVATWLAESGETGEIAVSGAPRGLLSKMDRPKIHRGVTDSLLDRSLRVIRCAMSLSGSRGTYWDRMVSERNRGMLAVHVIALVKSSLGDRAAELFAEWKAERRARDMDLFADIGPVSRWAKARGVDPLGRLAFWLDLWRRKDRHMRQFEADERERATRQRNAIYRQAAIHLATKFGELVTDNTNIADMAKLAEPDERDDATEKSRATRHGVAPGEARAIMRDVFGKNRQIIVSAIDNSARCWQCAAKLAGDPMSVIRACETHGPIDVDANNCRNLLRRAGDGERSGGDENPGGAREAEIQDDSMALGHAAE